MKRLWVGLGLLAVTLAMSLWISDMMGDAHRAGAQDLERAAALASEGNWTGAEELAGRAETIWKEKRSVTASFVDHEPMDDAEGLFAQLEYYAKEQDTANFSAACAQLATLLKAIANAHQFSLPNFF